MPRSRCALAFVVLLVLACDPAPAPEGDAGGDAGGSDAGGGDAGACATDADCDDGLFCSGPERCAPGDPAADARGCVAGAPPCTGEPCDEDGDVCASACTTDADGDG